MARCGQPDRRAARNARIRQANAINKNCNWEEYRMIKSLLGGLFAATALVHAQLDSDGATGNRRRPGRRSGLLQAADRRNQVLQVAGEARPYRIALANGFIANDWRMQMIKVAKAYASQPDVPPRHQGIQGRLDRPGRGSADCCGEQLHRFRATTRLSSTPTIRGLWAGRQEGERSRRRPVVVRQRHRRSDERPDQRGPGGHRPSGRRIPAQGNHGRCRRSSCSCAVLPAIRSTQRAPRASTRPWPLRAGSAK